MGPLSIPFEQWSRMCCFWQLVNTSAFGNTVKTTEKSDHMHQVVHNGNGWWIKHLKDKRGRIIWKMGTKWKHFTVAHWANFNLTLAPTIHVGQPPLAKVEELTGYNQPMQDYQQLQSCLLIPSACRNNLFLINNIVYREICKTMIGLIAPLHCRSSCLTMAGWTQINKYWDDLC